MKLGHVIRKWRGADGIGVREAAKQIGISHPTLSRIENGKPCNSEILAQVLLWMIAPETRRAAASKQKGEA